MKKHQKAHRAGKPSRRKPLRKSVNHRPQGGKKVLQRGDTSKRPPTVPQSTHYGVSFEQLCQLCGNRQDATELIRQHIKICGMGLATYTKDIVAAHEAGHILIGHILGFRPKCAEIWLNEAVNHWEGGTEYVRGTGLIHILEDHAQVYAEAANQLAGVCGENVIGQVFDLGSSADEVVYARSLFQARHDFGVGNVTQSFGATMATLTWLLKEHLAQALRLKDDLINKCLLDKAAIKAHLTTVPVMGMSEYYKMVREFESTMPSPDQLLRFFGGVG